MIIAPSEFVGEDTLDFHETLLEELCPQFLRPYPTIAIAQLTPQENQLRKTYLLEKGAVLSSNPGGEEKTICRFTTTRSLNINPLRISHVSSQGSKLSIYFECDQVTFLAMLNLRELILYLPATSLRGIELFKMLTYDVKSVHVNTELLGNQTVLRPYFHTTQTSSFDLLRDYFSCHQQYLFISMHGLENISWPEKSQSFTLTINTAINLPDNFFIKKDMFLLNCVPIINLYTMTSEPIQLTHQKIEYPLIPDTTRQNSIFLYNVNQVTGVNLITGKRYEYKKKDYSIYTRHRWRNKNTSAMLFLKTHPTYEPEHLCCTVTVCNGDYPYQHLQNERLTFSTQAENLHFTVEKLHAFTSMLLPPMRNDFTHLLLTHLVITYRSLADLTTFKQLLQLYDWTNTSENKRTIEAIREIRIKKINFIHHGVHYQGMDVFLVMNEEFFRLTPEAYLFGLTLHYFFTTHAPLNTLVQTKLVLQPSCQTFLWKPLFGKNVTLQ